MLAVRGLHIFIFFYLGLTQNFIFAQAYKYEDIKFVPATSLSSGNNISQNTIFAIEQDTFGFMWFGTQTGLERYDGREYKSYFYDAQNKFSISKGYVIALCSAGQFLWIGTEYGLSKLYFDKKKNKEDFTVDIVRSDIKNVKSICKIRNNKILYATDSIVYNEKGDTLYKMENRRINVIAYSQIDSTVFIGSSSGLFYFKPDDQIKSVKTISYFKDMEVNSIDITAKKSNSEKLIYIGCSNKVFGGILKNRQFDNLITPISIIDRTPNKHTVSKILQDTKGGLWIGTINSGLFYQENRNSAPIAFRRSNSGKQFTLSSNLILSLFESNDGVIWVGTNGGGINKWASKKQLFNHVFNFFDPPHGLAYNNDVWAIYQKNNLIFLGTDGNGVAVYEKNNIINYKKNNPDYWIEYIKYKSFKNNQVKAINSFKEKWLLLGTEDGVYKIPLSKNIRNLAYSEVDKISNIPNDIAQIYTTDNFCLIGTREHGIYILDANFNTIKLKSELDKPYSINCIISKTDNIFFVGTEKGLYELNFIKKSLSKVNIEDKIKNIRSILSINEGDTIWIGTQGNGLFKVELLSKRTLREFNKHVNLLRDNVIYGILQDTLNNIWISTNYGISKISNDFDIVNNYSVNDGLQNKEFNKGAYFQSNKELLFFGGVNGLNWFNPLLLKTNSNYNENLQFACTFEMSSEEGKVKELTLNENNSKFIIPNEGKFLDVMVSIFNYHDPDNNLIKYKLGSSDSSLYLINNHLLVAEIIDLKFGKNAFILDTRKSYESWLDNNIFIDLNVKRPKSHYIYIIAILLIASLILVITLLYRRNKKNKKLNYLENQLEDKKNQIENNDQILNLLNNKINEINRKETTEEIFELAAQHLVNFKYFSYDYAIIYIIDKYKNKITKSFCSPDKNIFNPKPEDWRNIDKDINAYNLINDDILSIVFNNKDILLEVNGKEIVKLEGSNDLVIKLDDEVFKKNNHQLLRRFFLPIVKRSEEKKGVQEGDFTFGVLEVGNHINSKKEIPLNSTINFLKNYVDNLAQSYHKIFSLQNLVLNKEIPIKYYDVKEPQNYLQLILNEIIEVYELESGDIALIDLNQDEESWVPTEKYSITNNIPKEELYNIRKNNTQKGIFRHVSSSEPKVYYYSGNVKFDTFYLPGLKDVESQLTIPLQSFGKFLGTLSLYSNKKDYFDEFKAKNIQNLSDIFTDIYYRKMAYFTLEELVVPVNTFLDNKPVYDDVINIIEKYFFSNSIKILNSKNIWGLLSLPYILKEIKVVAVNEKIKNDLNDIFWNGHGFKSLITAPIILDENHIEVILIGSMRKIDLFSEDKLFLSQVANKFRLSLQSISILNSFADLTKPLLEGKPEDVYKKITDTALQIFEADVVLLFKIVQGKHTNLMNVVHSGKILSPIRENSGYKEPQNINAIDIVNEVGEVYISGENEYISSEFNASKRNWESKQWSQDFWHRENIKSFAANRLGTIESLNGVLFINYRNKVKNFDDSFKKLFLTFSKLAHSAMENALIREENITLKNMNIKITKPYIESFIFSGIAHDTGNLVYSLARRLDEFKENIDSDKSENLKKENIYYHIDNIQRVIDALEKDYFKIRKFRKSEDKIFINKIGIDKIIDELKHLVQSKARLKNVEIKVNYLSRPEIECDESYLMHALLNIVINAIEEFKQSNGNKIQIVTDIDKNKENVIIKIIDNGPGIKQEDKSKIFEVYYTTKKDGTGLGLPITRYIIEIVHKGRITFSSEYRKGMTFEIILPIKQEKLING